MVRRSFWFAFAAQSSFEPPTVIEQVPIAYQPQAVPVLDGRPVGIVVLQHSCFGAGTLVRAHRRLVRIENFARR